MFSSLILAKITKIAHLGLLVGDAVDSETAFHIINQAEVFSSLLNADHICNPEHNTVILCIQPAPSPLQCTQAV